MNSKGINGTVLKIIAAVSMIIDHYAASGLLKQFSPGGLFGMNCKSTYILFRGIGRLAFPIFCFLIIEGVRYTKNWKLYALRLLIFAALTEVPFDRLFSVDGSFFDWTYQNVLFTLLLGMLCAAFLRFYDGPSRYMIYATLVITAAMTAETFLLSDYGASGVAMIGVMGYLLDDKPEWAKIPDRAWTVFVCAAAIGTCCLVQMNVLELPALFALIPISLYNGERGLGGRAAKYIFYSVYPLHLLIFCFLLNRG
ncbi:MAG: conjugal transfer protein TraX [Lachnospiraceae bacterium]|nr:conjugal transfer protein TraX [Lachnospiraceae bacterium]